ncbi:MULTISPECIES: catechol 1,2-dioxygenase [Chromohalobacter]|uniref:catechol 1,2-dioxygenase n=1 Tax=Chromohalobacter TaxID=42054 RepID=UPI000D70FDA3|nr:MULTISPECIES: catechol 1,2-dioxygenase [Chromohalobacter]MDO0945175.1 catechol 1,2-dioxygenase [Chromohalobacter salexigens]NQY47282.1 catechol 1,2-dioxygenase [Chromohalobacter sp.]NWO55641.1 catechol 1,2-dioxygenase [Chromohalobacter salexigens]PWW42700.1 catechol 1,2-dioxygenase [Chromohalobacter salexigens]
MTVKIYDTREVQEFLNTVSGFEQAGGNARAKQIMHRLLSDVYQLMDDFDVTPEEFWSTVSLLNELGKAGQFGLLAPGLGFDHYLDMRMDAADEQAGLSGGTPRTIEGPLYVAGAPVSEGEARMDDGTDTDAEIMWLTGLVRDTDGNPIPDAQVEIWHADSKGNYSFFDPSQSDYNLRRTIMVDAEGRYRVRSIIPSGYGVPPESPTDQVLSALGRHGQRPAHIHFFISAPGYRHLTTQINLAGDPYTFDDFAFATREELVVEAQRIEDATEAEKRGLDGPFTEVIFDVELARTSDPDLQSRHKRPRALEEDVEARAQKAVAEA